MNLSFFIATRYFFSKKKKNFINIISLISMAVVAIGTMSLIVALSVFNGLEGLLRNMYGDFDPDLAVTPASGKSFQENEKLLEEIQRISGIEGVVKIIEDNALIEFKDAQRLVRMKGVSEEFHLFSGIRNKISSGEFQLTRDSLEYAIVGRGIQYDLSLSLQNDFYTLQFYYPKDIGPGVLNPSKMYNRQNILPGGIFAIEKYYDDNFVFVPLHFASRLMDYEDKISGYDIYLDKSASPRLIKMQLQQIVGDEFLVRTGDELHSDLYKILSIEKLFVFIILTSIIGIASINIFFSLTMLVIEKKKDISVLIAQGAPKQLIRNIFLKEGCIVAFTGAIIGITTGLLLCFIQKQYGLVGMGINSAVVNAYPIEVVWTDVIYTVTAIIIITLLASIHPANRASKSYSLTSL
ncbi:MAG: FtsX-like permease family protein [Bacteroidota bacterium]